MMPFGLIIGLAIAGGILVMLHNFSETKQSSDDMLKTYAELLEKARLHRLEPAPGEDDDEADVPPSEAPLADGVDGPATPHDEFSDLATDEIKMGGV